MKDARTIVLTGATRGLGLVLAKRFAELGHTVLGCGRSHELVASLKRGIGERHDLDVVDVVNEDEVRRWSARLLERFGAPDLLINNAAVMNDPAPLWTISADEFARLLSVNVNGVVNVIRHFVPAMVENNRGVIINLSSGWGRHTAANVAPYCASKWAIEGLTRSLAQELPKGMAAIPLNPGIIATDMLTQVWGEDASRYPSPDVWVERAAPFILGLGPGDNGKPLDVPKK